MVYKKAEYFLKQIDEIMVVCNSIPYNPPSEIESRDTLNARPGKWVSLGTRQPGTS